MHIIYYIIYYFLVLGVYQYFIYEFSYCRQLFVASVLAAKELIVSTAGSKSVLIVSTAGSKSVLIVSTAGSKSVLIVSTAGSKPVLIVSTAGIFRGSLGNRVYLKMTSYVCDWKLISHCNRGGQNLNVNQYVLTQVLFG